MNPRVGVAVLVSLGGGSVALAQDRSVSPVVVESFEAGSQGPLPAAGWVGSLGRFTGAGAISSRRARTGRRSLRILGGAQRSVSLALPAPREGAVVRFWAERWTRREPFEFTVEAEAGTGWREVYRDRGEAIAIGGLRSEVQFVVGGAFRGLRFTCTSPEGSGLLLDDLQLAAPAPMRIVAVTAEQPVRPVLVGKADNPVVRLRIETVGQLDPVKVNSVKWTLASGRGRKEIAAVRSFLSVDSDPRPGAWSGFGGTRAPAAEMTCEGEHTLRSGVTFLWLAVTLDPAAVDLDGFVDGGCPELRTSAGVVVPKVRQPAGRQRLGIAVRDGGDQGVHTFRIPGIVTTDRGTLIAVYDVRRRSGGDLPGDIDVGMSRSRDGGRTWAERKIILDMGDDPAWRYDGVGDPAILFDPAENTLWVAATWSHGNRSWHGSGPGLTPEKTGQLMLVKSVDDGVTWSRPINITRQVKDPAWSFLLQSPGRGIAMADGTLVFGAQYRDPPDRGRTPHGTILWSRDHGATWHLGTGARPGTTECQPVEVAPGRILLNLRDNRGGLRSVLVTEDLGATWRPHPSDRRALVEPTCNAGLLVVRPGTGKAPSWLVFANPAVAAPPRREMTVKLSTDGGVTWPRSGHLLLDGGRCAGYPSVTRIDAETIGLLYEGSRAQLTFQRIPLADLMPQ